VIETLKNSQKQVLYGSKMIIEESKDMHPQALLGFDNASFTLSNKEELVRNLR
jgi:hypothetical protein